MSIPQLGNASVVMAYKCHFCYPGPLACAPLPFGGDVGGGKGHLEGGGGDSGVVARGKGEAGGLSLRGK